MVSSVTLRHRFSTHMDSLTVEMASYRGMLHINMLITLVTNYTGIDNDGPLSVGQKNVMTVICWMAMAALRDAARRWALNAMVSAIHCLCCFEFTHSLKLEACQTV